MFLWRNRKNINTFLLKKKKELCLTHYHTCLWIWTSLFYCLLRYLKPARWLANSVGLNQMPNPVAFDMGLHCLLKPVYPDTYGKYSSSNNYFFFITSALTLALADGLQWGIIYIQTWASSENSDKLAHLHSLIEYSRRNVRMQHLIRVYTVCNNIW